MAAEELAMVVAAVLMVIFLFRSREVEKKRDAGVLMDMKTRFFPKLLNNLRETFQKLESEESIEMMSYRESLDKELSVTLLLEFKMRFDKQGNILSKLREKLTAYDDKISLLGETPESEELKSELAAMNGELKEEVSNLLGEVDQLTKVERLPPRIPSFFRKET